MRLRRDPGHLTLVGGPVPRGAAAITLGRVVIVRTGHEGSESLMDHENVHVRQFAKYGWFGFGVRYLGAYLRWRWAGYPHWAAYRRIPLEAEAEWEARRKALSRR